jgi:hypothetical protein
MSSSWEVVRALTMTSLIVRHHVASDRRRCRVFLKTRQAVPVQSLGSTRQTPPRNYFFLGFRSLFGRWLGAKSGLDQ